jgi:hypothetical protein
MPPLTLLAFALTSQLLPACGSKSGESDAMAGRGFSTGGTASMTGSSGSSSAGMGGSAATDDGDSDARAGNGGASNTTAGGGASNTTAGGGAFATTGGGGSVAAQSEPTIPAIEGTCPSFVTGTTTIAGLAGISLQVGPKKEGTGSLLFYWHGTGSSASEVNSLLPAAVRQEILAQGGIIVSFEGSLGTGGDCSGTKIFSKDDFKVADLIAACAIRDHGIDSHRIFTTGCSAGGLQAGCMGALRSSYIAATAPNSGGEISQLTIQDPTRVPAVLTMHGGESDKVIVSFATTSASYDHQMKAAGSFVVNCDHGGSHCGAPAALQTAAWAFMKAHPFGVSPEPYAAGLPAAFPSYCAAQ